VAAVAVKGGWNEQATFSMPRRSTHPAHVGRNGEQSSRADTLTALTPLITLLIGVATIAVMYIDVRETRRFNQIAQPGMS
jgi:hypothetical protein